MKRVLVFLVFTIVFFFLPANVLAAGEFSSSYNVTYDVDESGVTTVTEQVALKNLTDKFYAASFSLKIGATQISDVSASDSQGPLDVSVEDSGKNTQVQVKFKQQITGLDKENKLTLRFKSRDFAQKQGKIWQVSVPKIAVSEGLSDFNLSLQVPVSFGDPTSILPEPRSQSESAGKLVFRFSKEQLLESGILANFGSSQLFDYNLVYRVDNSGVLPAIAKLPLPANTQYQEVLINNISPRPENVTVDKDGNFIGWFKLEGKQSIEVKVDGLAKLYINPQAPPKKLSDEEIKNYTKADQYWDKDNPIVQARLKEIFGEGEPKTNREKARLIHKYIANALSYDETRLENKDFERLGTLAVLNTPERALCSEFTDLFVALARAAGIPARMLTGYAYTSNQQLRPLSLDNDVLHAWPEYYDPGVGWVMIDPTWENSTGGVDYFTKIDLNHFVLATRGISSLEPSTADSVSVKFSEDEFIVKPSLDLSIDAPSEIFAGFPASAKVKIENKGNLILGNTQGSFTSAKIDLLNIDGSDSRDVFALSVIPPFGHMQYSFDLRTKSFLESYEDVLQLSVEDSVVSKKITVKPFFAFKKFSYGVGAVVAAMVGVYAAVVFVHFKMSSARVVKKKK